MNRFSPIISVTILLVFLAGCHCGTDREMVNDTVHPYAIYLLWGGDCALADSSGSVVAVDIDAVAKSNAVCGLKLFKRDGWYGFVDRKKTFKYRIIGIDCRTGFTKVLCFMNGGGSGNFMDVLLLRQFRKKTFDQGNAKFLNVICCEGVETVASENFSL